MASMMGRYVIVIVMALISWALYFVMRRDALDFITDREDSTYSKVTVNRPTNRYTVKCGSRIYNLDISTDPKCLRRLEYLRNVDRHECFEKYGVPKDANNCTLLRYLIYTEKVCPGYLGPKVLWEYEALTTKPNLIKSGKLRKANVQLEFDWIFQELHICGEVCEWMRRRIDATRTSWANAANNLFFSKLKSQLYAERRKLIILVHIGILTKEFGLDFGRRALDGGPLGELVQWADLLVSLHALGHDVVLSWSKERLKEILIEQEQNFNFCKRPVVADLVFTDVSGVEQMRQILGTIHHYRCRLRVLDVFGTEPEFNHPRYQRNKVKGRKWGGIGLNPKQFFTHFPHTPDNSFLGFAVQQSTGGIQAKRARCLLYGKNSKYLEDISKSNFLQILRKHFPDMHATMTENEGEFKLPSYITNQGVMDQDNFRKLLSSSKLYVGLGQPVEGPAPLEAIANGVIFLNPKFTPEPRKHDGKPTSRTLTSQHPYAEIHIGQPYVYTVDLTDEDTVDTSLEKIKLSKPNNPKVPYEFTHSGFLERINAYIENQDFCPDAFSHDPYSGTIWNTSVSTWPPLSSLIIKLSNPGESCGATCTQYNMTCEREYFQHINHKKVFQADNLACSQYGNNERYSDQKYSLPITDRCHAPSIDRESGFCFLQTDPLLFSCACVPSFSTVRVCPCRKYKYEQISLCVHCE